MLTAADLSAIVAACWAHPSGVSYLAKIQAIHDLAHCVCAPANTVVAAGYSVLQRERAWIEAILHDDEEVITILTAMIGELLP